MDPRELAGFIDQSVLQPEAVAADVEAACRDAQTFGFRAVVVPSGAVSHARRLLGSGPTLVVSTVAFPHGNAAADIKAAEARRAAQLGADEIDYVISIGAARDGDYRYVREEGVAIMRAVRGKIVKAILEVGHLTEEAAHSCAQGLAEAGVPYVKTCTGFGPGPVTEDQVRMLLRAVRGRALVKASGGIRERWQALRMLDAGAAVIGTSRGVAICSE